MDLRRCPKCGGAMLRKGGFAQEPSSPPGIMFSRFVAHSRWRLPVAYVCVKCGFTEFVPG